MRAGTLGDRLGAYRAACKQAEEAAHEFGQELVRLLRQVLPDLTYSVGWEEAGVDVVCLWAPSRDVTRRRRRLVPPTVELVAELGLRGWELPVDAPYGIYVTEEELARIVAMLDEAGVLEDGRGRGRQDGVLASPT